MFGVVEIKADVFHPINNPIGLSKLVTGRARTDISVARNGVRFMTLKTGDVRFAASRNVHPASAFRLMAGRAIGFLEMLSVIKIRFKAFHRRKRFQLVRVRFGMTNHADRMRAVLKLRRVASDARRMPGKFRFRRIFVALMT